MEKIVLEHRFTNHQKITFLLYIGAPFLIQIFFQLEKNMNTKDYLIISLCFLCYTFLISIAFLKRGLLKVDKSLYKGSFFRGKLFFKTKIEISGKSKIAVLKFRKSQKLAWFSDAKPDLSVKYNCFEINLLNEKHTKREPILELSEEKNAKVVTEFLTEKFDLKYEKYNPQFRNRKSRQQRV